jgi:hypothetical protein
MKNQKKRDEIKRFLPPGGWTCDHPFEQSRAIPPTDGPPGLQWWFD